MLFHARSPSTAYPLVSTPLVHCRALATVLGLQAGREEQIKKSCILILSFFSVNKQTGKMGLIGEPRPTRPRTAKDDDAVAVAGVSDARSIAAPDEKEIGQVEQEQTGVANIEASQAIWGKTGRWLIILG